MSSGRVGDDTKGAANQLGERPLGVILLGVIPLGQPTKTSELVRDQNKKCAAAQAANNWSASFQKIAIICTAAQAAEERHPSGAPAGRSRHSGDGTVS